MFQLLQVYSPALFRCTSPLPTAGVSSRSFSMLRAAMEGLVISLDV